ncbi:uncharacterized protein CELE_C54E4.12 [Caenorhabditis elegans]|uniref:Secreted protein n=1 Tax=Caenorhabditis elegans TaxID=6239 RepID=U4PS12_CAEEL|nr:Secreted protein [Caenorhabditis elegans]CDH93380.1 Secreted protein [Caenorhabditis elegans]|eukprot:NP_001294577.1 Uncharacterized protein CELE_C54E4.12 [Caenorhabditis elegans]
MYRQSMANGAAASVLFFIFLFVLARHMKKLKVKLPPSNKPEDEVLRELECGNLPPPYFVIPSQPPPTYQEALKMQQTTNT